MSGLKYQRRNYLQYKSISPCKLLLEKLFSIIFKIYFYLQILLCIIIASIITTHIVSRYKKAKLFAPIIWTSGSFGELGRPAPRIRPGQDRLCTTLPNSHTESRLLNPFNPSAIPPDPTEM